jgi:Protein of unknown function (DUF2510)
MRSALATSRESGHYACVTKRDDVERSAAPPGWYPDPWQLAASRWYDGTQWTGATSNTQVHASPYTVPKLFRAWPHNRPQWLAFCVSAVVGLAIWIPTMAAQPRYSNGPHQANGSPWFVPLTFLAVVILAALFSRNWQVVAPGIATAQFLMAPWTTPRGDNDGLWAMIFVILAFLFVIEHLLAGLTGTAVGWVRDHGSPDRKRVSV